MAAYRPFVYVRRGERQVTFTVAACQTQR